MSKLHNIVIDIPSELALSAILASSRGGGVISASWRVGGGAGIGAGSGGGVQKEEI